MSQALADQYKLERKDEIPEDVRTPDRDKAAKVIDDMWPAKLKKIAEEAGYSRQHIKNTIAAYYDMVEYEDEAEEEATEDDTITIEVPSDVETGSYLRGVADSLERAN